MTLLELLCQELPKRGGWPEGGGFAWQDDDGEVRFNNGIERDFYPENKLRIGEKVRPENHILVRRCDTFVVTREQYEATDWNDVGLPPIDIECEYSRLPAEAERAIDEMVRLSGVSIGAAKILYDAGYRK